MPGEPRTEAGKRLDLAWPGSHLDRLDWQDRILAIEAEAAAINPEWLARARAEIENIDVYGRDGYTERSGRLIRRLALVALDRIAKEGTPT